MKTRITPHDTTHRKIKKSLIFGFFAFLLSSFLGAYGFLCDAPLTAATTPGTRSPIPKASSAWPESFADLSEKLSRTVVNIKITKVAQMQGPHWRQRPEGPFGDLFEHFFRQMPQRPNKQLRQGAGSGVIISPDGYILTNNHVVEGAKELSVTLNDQREYAAHIIGSDPKTDLAIVKIDTMEKLPSAVMGDSDQLRVGEWVLAIGNPFGLSHTVTSGIVSAKGRIIGAGPYDDFIQTDASINPGNSGGPLYNMKGELVGINTAIIPQGQGIGFAIPVNTAKPLIPQLVKNGEVQRGYLGVNIQDITPELAKALKLDEAEGALVSAVHPETPAQAAGIKRGDVIIAYNNKPVKKSHDLPALVAATPAGEKAEVTVLRKNKKKTLTVKIAELQENHRMARNSKQHKQDKLGLMLQNLDSTTAQRLGLKNDKGVLVSHVKPGSPSAVAGLRQGDVILEINQNAVDSVEEALKEISPTKNKESLLMLVSRNHGSFYLILKG